MLQEQSNILDLVGGEDRKEKTNTPKVLTPQYVSLRTLSKDVPDSHLRAFIPTPLLSFGEEKLLFYVYFV